MWTSASEHCHRRANLDPAAELTPSPSQVDDEPYAERYREAYALLQRNEIYQCKTKLDGIQREFGAQPPILVAKLYCQLMVADVESAAETCLKLAKLPAISVAEQVYYQALAFELSAKKSGASCPIEFCTYELADEHAMEQRLVSSIRLTLVKDQTSNQFVTATLNEEVPPKAHYLVSTPLPGLSPELSPFKPSVSGTSIYLLGRQTDRPPRLFTIEPKVGWNATQMQSVLDELQVPRETRKVVQVTDTNINSNLACSIRVDTLPTGDLEKELSQFVKEFSHDRFLDFPAPLLNGGTPRSRAGEPEYRTELHALALSCLASGALNWAFDDYLKILETLKLERIRLPADTDLFDTVGGASYFFADFEQLSSNDFMQLAQAAFIPFGFHHLQDIGRHMCSPILG